MYVCMYMHMFINLRNGYVNVSQELCRRMRIMMDTFYEQLSGFFDADLPIIPLSGQLSTFVCMYMYRMYVCRVVVCMYVCMYV